MILNSILAHGDMTEPGFSRRHGVEWNGLEWNHGVEWSGVDLSGVCMMMECNAVEWNGMDRWNAMQWSGMEWMHFDHFGSFWSFYVKMLYVLVNKLKK